MSEENTNTVLFTVADREYTAEDAQKKIENADTHIKTIEEENADLRKKVDEYMEALAKTQELKEPEPAKPENTEPKTPGISAEEIAKIVQAQLAERETASTAEKNINAVKATMLERYGNQQSANEEFAQKAKEMGLTTDEALDLAKRSPKVVLSWFGDVSTPTPSHSTGHNTQSVAGTTRGPKEGTWAWWQEIRKNDPKTYNSPSMARKRMQDAERLGKEGFFGN